MLDLRQATQHIVLECAGDRFVPRRGRSCGLELTGNTGPAIHIVVSKRDLLGVGWNDCR